MDTTPDNTLEEHPFLKALLDRVKPTCTKAAKRIRLSVDAGRPLRVGEEFDVSPSDAYQLEVFRKAVSLLETLERMESCRELLRYTPSTNNPKVQAIGHDRLIEYHFGYYVILFVSIYDMALILSNSVFRLGNPDENCKEHIVRANVSIKGTETDTALEKIKEIVNPYKKLRNVYVHRGKAVDVSQIMSDPDLDNFMFICGAARLRKSLVPAETLDSAFRLFGEKITLRIDDGLVRSREALAALFWALLPIYESMTTLETYREEIRNDV